MQQDRKLGVFFPNTNTKDSQFCSATVLWRLHQDEAHIHDIPERPEKG